MTKYERLIFIECQKKMKLSLENQIKFQQESIMNAIKEGEEIRNGKPVYFNGFINKLIDSNGIKG